MSEKKSYTLAKLAEYTNSKVIGDTNAVVNNLSTLEDADSESISFYSNQKYKKYLKSTKALAVVVGIDVVQQLIKPMQSTCTLEQLLIERLKKYVCLAQNHHIVLVAKF